MVHQPRSLWATHTGGNSIFHYHDSIFHNYKLVSGEVIFRSNVRVLGFDLVWLELYLGCPRFEVDFYVVQLPW